jgi:integrase
VKVYQNKQLHLPLESRVTAIGILLNLKLGLDKLEYFRHTGGGWEAPGGKMEIRRQTGSLRVGDLFYTATVFVRHNPKCEYAKVEDSGSVTKCDCRKSILVYDGAKKKQDRISAHTRSWAQATIQAEEWLDKFDPTKAEQKRQEANAVTVEQAVSAFIADKKFRNLAAKTVDTNRCLLGDATAEGVVTREGKLFSWLAKQTPRINYISEITSGHLLQWRDTWNYGSDLTAFIAWGTVKEFFKFCTTHGWVLKNPTDGIKYPAKENGNRTAIFTDDQYNAILAAAKGNDKLEAFVLLLRWSAMAIIDATLFSIKSIDDKGVLRYKREKTGELATVQLPDDVTAKLREVSKSADQPFRTNIKVQSDTHKWRRALQELFATAKIESVTTEIGERPPHPHMFRDTCIVGHLRDGMSLHSAAKILGHSNTNTIQTHYLPFVKELEKTVIDETRDILKKKGLIAAA